MTSRTRRPQPRGFNLIELMTVFAIIGILASIAIPVFIRYQNKARQSERPQLMTAMARGMVEYIEQQGRMPTVVSATESSVTCGLNPPAPITGAKKTFDANQACWTLLGVKPEGNVYHHFTIVGSMTTGAGGEFTIQSVTDIDADGQPSAYEVKYEVVGSSWERTSEGLTAGTDDF